MSTRRPSMVLAAALLCTLVSACGSDDGADGATASTAAADTLTPDTATRDTVTDDTTGGTAAASTASEASVILPATAPQDGGSGSATLTFQGETYEFSSGGCSPTLDPNQFVFRDPATPNVEATYFAITVTVDEPATDGGTYPGAVTYQRDGAFVVTVSDATLEVADDLRSGTFSGEDFLSGEIAEGSWTC